jgi:hypothetical protein
MIGADPFPTVETKKSALGPESANRDIFIAPIDAAEPIRGDGFHTWGADLICSRATASCELVANR